MAGKRSIPSLITLALLLSPASVMADISNPGQYGGFVPPHELEQLQNIDPDNAGASGKDEFDPYFSVENDPWEHLPTPFDDVPEEVQEMREEARQMRDEARRRAQKFISERELQMIENPAGFMRRMPRHEPGVWGDLNDNDGMVPPQYRSPPPRNGGNYPYGSYPPPMPSWQGSNPGYMPGFGGGYAPGYNASPYIFPGMPGTGMPNSIAPFLY